MQAYSDASFAPGGGHSIGAVIIMWNGSPMMWRAGKQPFPTLSAAEAELTEATEAMLMGDAFDALLADLFENYPRSLMVDNQAAIHLITEESGAWRTRHLRIRANHLRWRFSRLDWRALHCPGIVMAADLGTKPLSAARMEDLKVICGMSTEIEEDAQRRGGMVSNEEKLKKVLKMLVMASMVQVAKSQGDEEGQERQHVRREDDAIMWMMVAMYTFLVIIAVTIFQRAFGAWKQYTDDLAEGRREDMTATPEQRRRIRQAHILLDEAERQRNYAEEQLFRAVADVYRPRTISGVGSSRRTSMDSRRSSGRRSREEFEDEETERRRSSPSTVRRNLSEEYERTEDGSQVTREYQSPGSRDDERGQRFNAFDQAMEENEEPNEDRENGEPGEVQEHEGRDEVREGEEQVEPNEEGEMEDREVEGNQELDTENHRRVELPEYHGPGRYVEDATRGLRRRLDPLGEEGEEEEPEDPTGDFGSDLEEMSVRSEREVMVEQHVGPPQPRGEVLRDPRPEDAEPDREPEEGADGDRNPGVRGGDDPGPQELPGDMPNYQAWITPAGTRYHTTRDCVTLAQTRRIYRSQWCDLCGRRLPGQRYSEIYVARHGENAHHNINCPNIGLRLATTYPCCQRCPRLPQNIR